MYFQTKFMGEYLAEYLREDLYSLAFTSYYGDPNTCGVLEQELYQKNMQYGFIDFKSLRFKEDFFDKSFNSNIIRKKDGKWMYIWDGVYFIRDQKQVEIMDGWLDVVDGYKKNKKTK